MDNRDTRTPEEIREYLRARRKERLGDEEADSVSGLMEEQITVEPLENQDAEDTLDFLDRFLMLNTQKVAEAKETLGEQLADIKEKALANIDTIKNTQLKSKPNPFIGGPVSPMLTEEGVQQEVEKFVDPMLREPDLLEIPTETFDETNKQTEEALTDAEIAAIASSAIDDVGKAQDNQPNVDTVGEAQDNQPNVDTAGEAQDNQPNLDDAPTGGLMSPDRSGVQTGTTVKEAQQTLTDLGYKPQGVDGVLGKGSARAIRKLQKAADLPITGELTEEVIALLKSGNAPAYFDPPKKDAKVENISDSMFDVFKEAIAQKESSGRYSTYGAAIPKLGIKKGDPLYGGANMHYLGRYQMGKVALQDVGRGYSKTLNQAFLDDPDLQDKLFKKYTLQNHKTLTKNSKKYRDMSVKEKLGVLGYAHNQGAVSAEEWLYTGVSGADGLGTKGDEYTSLVRDAFAEESPDDMPN